MTENGVTTFLDQSGVEAILPHRRSMLLVRQVVETPAGLRAIFHVDPAGWYLDGHFGILPLSVVIEAMSQAAALLGLLRSPELNQSGLAFVAGHYDIKGRKPIKSDAVVEIRLDRLRLRLRTNSGFAEAELTASVGEIIVADGTISGLIRPTADILAGVISRTAPSVTVPV